VPEPPRAEHRHEHGAHEARAPAGERRGVQELDRDPVLDLRRAGEVMVNVTEPNASTAGMKRRGRSASRNRLTAIG
jgi:hypothetical protein